MTTCCAKDSDINLDLTEGTIVEANMNTTVEGPAYCKNHMGRATPDRGDPVSWSKRSMPWIPVFLDD